MQWLLDIIFPPREDEKKLRAVSTDTFLTLCNPQLIPITRPHTIALLPFSNTSVRAAIHEAKYRGNAKACELLSLALIEYLRDTEEARMPIIVPVPLGKKRHRERGFNQIEEILRSAKELSIPIAADMLVRARETESQVSLPRHKREENMRGVFKAMRRADPVHTYIVLDDVTTTGATLQAAIDALKEAGATHIIPLALAH